MVRSLRHSQSAQGRQIGPRPLTSPVLPAAHPNARTRMPARTQASLGCTASSSCLVATGAPRTHAYERRQTHSTATCTWHGHSYTHSTSQRARANGWLGSSRSSHLLRWACSGARHTWSRTHLCSAPRRRATSASSLPTYAWHGLGLRAVRHGMRHGMRLDMVSAALLGIPWLHAIPCGMAQ